ncbi:DASH family cryptochrome [Pseudohongiella spirulinae]|uniref:Cryptochrome DASH n=1 Tax=Pseudohongiella spirulinae TaxID=1249552 RepID=A0A0S2KCX9_9GAMM|nr:DASH family cryptochrome [Pseudohongiella spirulinae]ALO45839.1 FAD-binding protein [Pseudohongiella spirulinae]
MTTSLYWLTSDLRLDDNPALVRAAQADSLICVYCIDQRWFKPHRYHVSSMGTHRWRFLRQSLDTMAEQLRIRGQFLQIRYGLPEQQLAELIRRHKVQRLICSRQIASDELRILKFLSQHFPELIIEQVDTATLFDTGSFDISLETLRKGFTPYRKQVETLSVPEPLQAPGSLPRAPLQVVPDQSLPDWIPKRYQQSGSGSADFIGGENAASEHLEAYFNSDLPSDYKNVRDQLDDWENSSRLSPWLAAGCLSPRRITKRLLRYEQQKGANESSYWLYFELLWREYFHWLALAQKDSLFQLKGLRSRPPHACLHPERYRKWCHGNTPWPLVNACMRQLQATGYLSNRGRQIAASCFVNELGMDWRYGAAWFEHMLIDFDVASNWGNWQYIAGVGVDPRGGRHFDLAAQASKFDVDGMYVRRWAPHTPDSALDSVDAADWPIG